ncbi:MAG: HEAT repeat domain-containing protein [Prolixibacteraceae bacterium]|nr:HEAT repeat domain-containing protein [Prolixibacteraceae bacterium]
MKRLLTIIAIVIIFLISSSFVVINIWIGHDVKQNIKLAQLKYGGSAEDALITFLEDKNNSFNDRTHKAVWTLGQIRSEKALPILKKYYYDDPKGKTCKGNHNSMLCQYELHKAISAIENGRLFSFARLNK